MNEPPEKITHPAETRHVHKKAVKIKGFEMIELSLNDRHVHGSFFVKWLQPLREKV